MGPQLLCVTGLVWRVMPGFMPGIHGFLHQHFAYPPLDPPLEGEGDEPTGAREARPDHRLREPGEATLRKTTHPSRPPCSAAVVDPPPPGEGKRARQCQLTSAHP